MEMNTRLQVEHPVSEMITGFDFVELQLRVAAGEALPVAQADVTRHGHAVEARLYAEDPSQGFLPQTGRILDLQWPASSGDLRIETGVEQGSRISPYYDPMIAKLVAHGHDRGSATERLRHALRRTTLFGLKTNKGFLEELLAEPGFPTTTLATQFIDQRRETLGRPPRHLTLFGIVAWLWRLPPAASLRPGWTLDGMGQHLRLKLAFQGVVTDVLVGFGNNELALTLGDSKFNVTDVVRDGIDLSFRVEGEELAGKALAWASAGDVYAELAGYQVHVAEPDYQHLAMVPGSGGGVIRAPMPGRVLRLDARAGGKVEPGQNILVLEAMKMEHVMTAPTGGTVMELTVREGEQVREGDVLCRIEAAT
jgi:acetyl/propionyl-CoA carboxylase alpha subunit